MHLGRQDADHGSHGDAGWLKQLLATTWHAVAPPSEDFLPTLLRRDEEFHRAAAEPRRHDSPGSGEARS